MIWKLFEDQRLLMVAGSVSFICFIVLAGVAVFDSTQILGINRWIKPMKFLISIAIFLWTMAVYLFYLKDHERFSRRVSWALILIFVVEMVVIAGQPLRGTTSHFNTRTPLDAMLYAAMGIAIALSTVIVGAVAYRYFKSEIDLPRSVVWGMRLGLIVFILGCVQGGYMSAQTGHGVGVTDGGSGLPLVNWSTNGGDLRVAHFMGLHALQAVPLFAWFIEKARPSIATTSTAGFAIAYLALFTFLFVQALMGRPVIAGT